MNDITCPKCKHSNLPNAKFCQYCGTPIIPAIRDKQEVIFVDASGSRGIVNVGSGSTINQTNTYIGTQANIQPTDICPNCHKKGIVATPLSDVPHPDATSPGSGFINHNNIDIILIVTATNVETRAVLDVFCTEIKTNWSGTAQKTYYDLGLHGEVRVFLVQSEAGTAMPGGVMITLFQAIQDLQPQAIIMSGIACGFRPAKQQFGDILISKQVLYYESQKLDSTCGQFMRGDRSTASERLLDRFRNGDLSWQGAPRYFGLMMSGEKLINDTAFRDSLLKAEPEAIGGDMESGGLYITARKFKVDWIVVKAISDWGDGKKEDTYQQLAAKNSALFIRHVIHQGGWIMPDLHRSSNDAAHICPICGSTW